MEEKKAIQETNKNTEQENERNLDIAQDMTRTHLFLAEHGIDPGY